MFPPPHAAPISNPDRRIEIPGVETMPPCHCDALGSRYHCKSDEDSRANRTRPGRRSRRKGGRINTTVSNEYDVGSDPEARVDYRLLKPTFCISSME
ncbi:hypothetical protein Trydic_g113 [Trypoxylus dichotomus]